MNGDADDGKSRSWMRNFLISLSEFSRWFLNANFAEDFTREQGSRKQVNKEIFCSFCSLAVWSNQDKLSTEREDRRGPVTRGIRVRDASPNRAFVAHLNVADALRTFRQQRTDLLQQV